MVCRRLADSKDITLLRAIRLRITMVSSSNTDSSRSMGKANTRRHNITNLHHRNRATTRLSR
jgi:hypothetical protein